MGAGIGFSMPTFAAAAMGSLPPQVAGVGSGALNTLRQVGFSRGPRDRRRDLLAHRSSDSVQDGHARGGEVRATSRRELPPAAKEQISAGIVKAAAETPAAGAARRRLGDALAGGAAGAGRHRRWREQQTQLHAGIGAIFRDNVADAVHLAVLRRGARGPARRRARPLLTGRRLGEHEGHHEMTRGRAAPATRA